MSTAPDLEGLEQFPAPLEFLKTDYIHPDNQALKDLEQRRWRLLSPWERFKLRLFVYRLARELQKADYNAKVRELRKRVKAFRADRAAFRSTTFISEAARDDHKAQLLKQAQEIRRLMAALADLRTTFEDFQHFAGWLDYEAEHRADLKLEAKRVRKIRREMDREADWIEKLMLDVFRKTKGCHHITTNGKGKERTRVPKFFKSKIAPNAHYYYLAASRHFLRWHKWLLPYGVTIDNLMEPEVLKNMSAATHREVKIIFTSQNQLIFRVSRLDHPGALPTSVKWRDAMDFLPKSRIGNLPYTIGVTENNKFEWFDFETEPHILIGGKSQSGKSNLVNGIIGTLVSTHSPRELRVVLIDQKGGLEFSHWHELPHLLWDVVKTVDQVEPMFIKLVAVMRRRMAVLEKAHAKKFSDYNRKVDAAYQLERVLIVVDEMNTFVGMGKQTERLHDLLALLTSQGRAVGMHVIASTQHPEVRVIPSRIKTNMGMRLSGFMPSVVASMAVLDEVDATLLENMPGRFAAVNGLRKYTVQVPHILDEDIAGIVSSTRKAYRDVPENLSEMVDAPTTILWNEQRVLEGALELLEGQISGDKLHDVFKGDSPGIRELRRLCLRIRETVKVAGSIERESDHTLWKIKKRGSAFYLAPLDATQGANATAEPDLDPPTVEPAVVPEAELEETRVAAAD